MRAATRIPAAGGSVQPSSVSGLDINLGLLSSTSATHTAQASIDSFTLPQGNNIEDWFSEVLSSTADNVCNSGNDAVTTTPNLGYAVEGLCSEQEASPSDVSLYEFTPGSARGQGDDMEMEMDRLLDLLPSTATSEDFQGLLASMIDNEKVSQSKIGDDWNWELTVAAV